MKVMVNSFEYFIRKYGFLNSFDLLLETTIDEYQRERLSLYALKINANEFNYNNLQEQLVDPMIDYAVSREVKNNIQIDQELYQKSERKI